MEKLARWSEEQYQLIDKKKVTTLLKLMSYRQIQRA